jgi:class 3 adenylate cyclase
MCCIKQLTYALLIRISSWVVSTENKDDLHLLRTKAGASNGVVNQPTKFKCPMSGVEIDASDVPCIVTSRQPIMSPKRGSEKDRYCTERVCPISRGSMSTGRSSGTDLSALSYHESDTVDTSATVPEGGLSATVTRNLFPYHVIIDTEFVIKQVGSQLSAVLGTSEHLLYSYEVDEVFEFVKPKPAKWTHSWLRKLEDQEFILSCTLNSAASDIFFKGTLVKTNPGRIMLILCPDAKNLIELRDLNLTLSDLPAHGNYRDAVFLREHLSRQMNNALKMEKLSKTLQVEKELLESLLPLHAAEGLRRGKEVKPRLHNHVTMFFSDIVGFTNICESLSPWQVIDMLNRLYSIMDFLAKDFNLFKVETIGDAYVCCSGLPEANEKHAVNVANFAIAVSHCCRTVTSPLTGEPILLRIGIHSGPCASGIVGETNPRYCVFGDTVNTTARHESTGEPGRVHCSSSTARELRKQAANEFDLKSRGKVSMKGKGELETVRMLCYMLQSAGDVWCGFRYVVMASLILLLICMSSSSYNPTVGAVLASLN